MGDQQADHGALVRSRPERSRTPAQPSIPQMMPCGKRDGERVRQLGPPLTGARDRQSLDLDRLPTAAGSGCAAASWSGVGARRVGGLVERARAFGLRGVGFHAVDPPRKLSGLLKNESKTSLFAGERFWSFRIDARL